MDEPTRKSGWRLVRRMAAWTLIAFLMLMGAGIIYLKSLPLPDPEVLAEADNQYRRTRALFPDVRPTTGTAARTAIESTGTSSTLAAQARCDRLFREMIAAERGDGQRQALIGLGMISAEDVVGSVDKAKELAALYDQGVRVSPELQAEWMRHGGRVIINQLAMALWLDARPGETARQIYSRWGIDQLDPAERAKRFEGYFTALKLLRVVNAPVNDNGLELFMIGGKQRAQNILYLTEVEDLPPELMKMDLNLLAPREPLDWTRGVASSLDFTHDGTAAWQSLLKASNAFDFFKALNEKNEPDTWYKPIQATLIGAGGAIVGPPMFVAPQLTWQMERAKDMQDYARALARGQLDPANISYGTVFTLQMTNEQIGSRLLAGGIELRRGAAVPAPDKIGPDSYFFDPILQRPYKLYVQPAQKDWVDLCVRRQVAPHAPRQGEKPENEMDVTKIRLPANHPGLEGLPRL